MGRTKRIRRGKHNSVVNNEKDEGIYVVELLKYLGTLGWRNETYLSQKHFTDTGRGLYSKRNISKGDPIIQVPFGTLITFCTVENDNNFKEFFRSAFDNFKEREINFQAILSLYILFHKHHCTTKFKPFLKTLPKQFTNPIFCSKEELNFLPEKILNESAEQNKTIKRNYDFFKTAFKSEKCSCCSCPYFPYVFSLDSFKWAYFVVNSRCVYLDLNFLSIPENEYIFKKFLRDEPSLALAPFLDLLNHSDHARTVAQLTKHENDVFYTVYTCRDIKKYEQIFISYGDLTNQKLLLDYGFYLKGNEHDFFEFNLSDIEGLLKAKRIFTIHRNKFKFIKDHNLDQQMFVHRIDGLSHNLEVVLYLIFKEQSPFPNVLNQVAFGSTRLFNGSVNEEAQNLVEFKISEYLKYVEGLNAIQNLSASARQCLGYVQECISYLRDCHNKLF